MFDLFFLASAIRELYSIESELESTDFFQIDFQDQKNNYVFYDDLGSKIENPEEENWFYINPDKTLKKNNT